MKAITHHPAARQWLLQYKLYHIPCWLLFNYLWRAIALGNPVKTAVALCSLPYGIPFIFYGVFHTLAVCFNLYRLMPQLLEKARFTAYTLYLLLTMVLAAACIVPGYYAGAAASSQTLTQLYGTVNYCWVYFFTQALAATFAAILLSSCVRLILSRVQAQRKQQQLEKEKLETELNFLKNQFNPHFLFNTINAIFFLIHRDPDTASASLAKFSRLLRYQLYECNEPRIKLSSEVEYIENCIELEKLRLGNQVNVQLSIHVCDGEDFGIAPFILMTFIENACKHVSRGSGRDNWMKIKLHNEGSQLLLSVKNSTGTAPTEAAHYGGIGLKNVRRRLDLLYPGRYLLDIQNTGDRFEVQLQLQLTTLHIPEQVL